MNKELLHEKTRVIYFDDKEQVWDVSSVRVLYSKKSKMRKDIIRTMAHDKPVTCRIVRYNKPSNYVVTLANNIGIKTTEDYLNMVYGKGMVKTKDLTKDDFLPFYNKPIRLGDNLTYIQGKLVGAYLEAGVKSEDSAIMLALESDGNYDDIIGYCKKECNAKVQTWERIDGGEDGESSVSLRNLWIRSYIVRGLIDQSIQGANSFVRGLKADFLTTSEDFRRGIIDGVKLANPEFRNKSYATNSSTIKSLETLYSSMGIPPYVVVETYGDAVFYGIGDFELKNKSGNSYINDGDYTWVKIRKIEKVDDDKPSYSLEAVDDAEPEEFMLANGIVTYNSKQTKREASE